MISMLNELTKLTLDAEYQNLSALGPWVTAFMDGLPEHIETESTFSMSLVLAVHEVVANQIDHAYHGAHGLISLTLDYDAAQDAVIATIQDCGRALDVTSLAHTTWKDTPHGQQLVAVPEPTWDQDRGRGFFLIHSLTDTVVYETHGGTNIWTLTKSIKSS